MTSIRLLRQLPAFFLALTMVFGLAQVSRGQAECDCAPNLVQITLVPGVNIDLIRLQYGLLIVDDLPPSTFLLRVPLGQVVELLLQILDLDPRILVAEPAYRTETPEGLGQMMVAAVGATKAEYEDQDVFERLRLGDAHEHTTGEGILVAIVDTGVRANHEALVGAISPNGIDYVDDDSNPNDTANGTDDDSDGSTDEAAGHGTIIAGIVHLVAPDAQILPIRVLNDEGQGLAFDVAQGIRYAVDQGADVINLSLGMIEESELIADEIERAKSYGVSIVAAAGNDDDDIGLYPARDPHTLSIAALDSLDIKASFSNYHSTVSLSAPGDGILGPFYNGGYAIAAGTSFSTPFVGGVMALIRAINPSLTKTHVDSLTKLAVIDIYEIEENEPYIGMLGTGRVDALLAWQLTPTVGQRGTIATPGDDALAGSIAMVAPNPSRLTHPTEIRIDRALGAPAALRLVITDSSGRRVRTLLAGSGETVVWDGRAEWGSRAPAGVYHATWSLGVSPDKAARSSPIKIVRLP